MTPHRLLALHDRVADTPDAIPRLRRFILDLAVRGKLVEQDSTEQPASFTSSAGPDRAKGGKANEDQLASSAVPYALPASWKWVQIGDQLGLLNGMAFKPTDWTKTGIPIVRIQNLNRPDASFNFCHPAMARERSLIDDGAFLISWSGTPGTSFGAFIWQRGPAVLNQHIFRCDFKTSAFRPDYLRLAINGRLDEMIEKAHGGVGLQHITKGKLEAMLIGLPPLAEQHRIVAKVEELMGLLDRLEAERRAREGARDRLTTATLARLTTPEADPVTAATHTSFALKALPTLTTRPDQLKHLRQSILNLAVRGKLVEQDPADEPATQLLSRLAQGKLRRFPGQIAENASPYSLPSSWAWVPLHQLVTEGPQNGISPSTTSRLDAPKAITLTATTSGIFNPAHFKHVDANIPAGSGFWLRVGDLLFQRGNTPEYVGMAALYHGRPDTFLFPDLIMRVRLTSEVDLRFVHIAAIAPPARAYLSENAAGAQATMPKINQTTLNSLPIPLPPLSEQHRIVAKVDALMALCDSLEASLTTANTTRQRLLESLLHEALASTVDLEAAA